MWTLGGEKEIPHGVTEEWAGSAPTREGVQEGKPPRS